MKEEVDARDQASPGRHAVAYALGSAVMVGIATQGELFDIPEADPPVYRKDMGISAGPLQTTLGLWYPDRRQFWTPTTLASGGRYNAASPPPDAPA